MRKQCGLRTSPSHMSLVVLSIILPTASFISASSYAAEPKVLMESAVMQGAGDTVKITRIPVLDSTGIIRYRDVAMQFDVSDAGQLSLRPRSFKITASPTLQVGQFKPGVYHGSAEGICYPQPTVLYDVGSPGVLPGGRTGASINSRPTCGTDEFNAAWVCGPIKGHPNQAALTAAGITSSTLCWGTVQITNSDTQYTTYPGWRSGDIIGVAQTGNSIAVHNFGSDNIENTALAFSLCPTCK